MIFLVIIGMVNMIDLGFVSEFVFQHFEGVKVQGTHFLARCILCGDSKKSDFKKRFNLDWNNGNPGYHCFNCGRHGSFVQLYSILKGISEEEAVKEIFKKKINWDTASIKNKCSTRILDVPECLPIENFNHIIKDCFDINSNPDSIISKALIEALKKFYADRKINVVNHRMYVAGNGEYKNRIIIPIYDVNDNIIYFQARRIPGTKKDPKYKNPISPKELIIMNEHLFDHTKPIVVTEGIIDAWMIGNQATTCLGKEISEAFLDHLFKLNKKVIIALDNDVEAKRALRKFINENKYSQKCKYFLYPFEFNKFKDINNIVVENDINFDMYDIILKNSCDYSTAYTKLFISMKFVEVKNEQNHKYRNRLPLS